MGRLTPARINQIRNQLRIRNGGGMIRKRVSSLALVVALSVSVLFSCATGHSTPSAAPTVSITPSSTATANIKTFTGSTFGISASSMADALSKTLTIKGYPDAFKGTATEIELPSEEDVIAYSYNVCSGVSCNLYETKSSGELVEIILIGVSSDMSTDDSKTFDGYILTITAAFCASIDELNALDESLNFVDTGFTNGVLNIFNGSIASFIYHVNDDGIAMLFVTPY